VTPPDVIYQQNPLEFWADLAVKRQEKLKIPWPGFELGISGLFTRPADHYIMKSGCS